MMLGDFLILTCKCYSRDAINLLVRDFLDQFGKFELRDAWAYHGCYIFTYTGLYEFTDTMDFQVFLDAIKADSAEGANGEDTVYWEVHHADEEYLEEEEEADET